MLLEGVHEVEGGGSGEEEELLPEHPLEHLCGQSLTVYCTDLR